MRPCKRLTDEWRETPEDGALRCGWTWSIVNSFTWRRSLRAWSYKPVREGLVARLRPACGASAFVLNDQMWLRNFKCIQPPCRPGMTVNVFFDNRPNITCGLSCQYSGTLAFPVFWHWGNREMGLWLFFSSLGEQVLLVDRPYSRRKERQCQPPLRLCTHVAPCPLIKWLSGLIIPSRYAFPVSKLPACPSVRFSATYAAAALTHGD